MAILTFITVGTLKEQYLSEAVSEYKKRLSQYARVEEVNIKEEAIHNEEDRSEIERALSAEGERILSQVPKDSSVIALCVEGKELDSPALAEKIGEMVNKSGKITFIIGSSHGLCPAVKSRADFRLSVSKLTFPHQLMRPILFEAIYRAFTIIAGKKYHK